MSDDAEIRKAMELERARLLKEAADDAAESAAKTTRAAAISRYMADMDRLAADEKRVAAEKALIAAKFNQQIDGGSAPKKQAPSRVQAPSPAPAPTAIAPPKLADAQPASRTVGDLIASYRTDHRSRYQTIRYRTKAAYESCLKRLLDDCGGEQLASLKKESIQHHYDIWTTSGMTMAHGVIGMLRMLVNFGATVLEDDQCVRLSVVLRNMQFPRAATLNTELLTRAQVIAIRAKAHEMSLHSIALAQAFQFDCRLNQRDVIGDWVPLDEPGVSDVTAFGEKWLCGIRGKEIDENLILRHVTSDRQKLVEIDLKLAPMVLEEFARLPGGRPGPGPIIVRDGRDLPWQSYDFRRNWRQIATAAGVPKSVKNMRSKPTNKERATEGVPSVARR